VTEEQQFAPDWFSMPGDTLVAAMRRQNVMPDKVAVALEGGMDALRGLVAGSVSIDMRRARALAATLGGTAEFWLQRQANYERALDRAVRCVLDTEGEEWLERVPVPGGKSRGHLSEVRKQEELRRRLVFFNVNNLRTWMTRYGYLRGETQFRTSPTLLSDEGAVSIWLRQGEIEATMASTKPWNSNVLREKLDDVRKLSKVSHPARFLPKLRSICAEAGVALVIVRPPKGCRASGAVRFLAADKAMILLSFRFRADDQFWFTVFHELGHLLLHEGKTFVDDEETLQDDREREANEFASNCIIPKAREAEFLRLKPNREAILRFSVSLGIAAGLTVGQMQHREIIGHEKFNKLKRRWTWDEIEPALS